MAPQLSLTPSSALLQIQDMVAIRHTASNEQQRTTMILLCEDGSLRIYMANVDNTSYWLQPSLQPSCGISIMKPVRKRKAAATSESSCSSCSVRPHWNVLAPHPVVSSALSHPDLQPAHLPRGFL